MTTIDTKSRAHAQHLDSIDPLSHLRNEFHIPTKEEIKSSAHEFDPPTDDSSSTRIDDDEKCIYFCGNSLGLQPIRTRTLVDEELNVWARRGVVGHVDHTHDRPWVSIDDQVTGYMAQIVGAETSEVAVMGTLTSNIHFLLAAFYKPTKERFKIIMEGKAFPSDQYAIVSQLLWHNLDPAVALVTIFPIPHHNPNYLTTTQILQTIDAHQHDTALIMLSGLQYYTGQAFDMQTITKYAKDRDITVGWDLAHAVGNIPLSLHDWDVDFAAWCTYKYLNSGPGGIAGIFVNDKHSERHRLAGWWGHDRKTRFIMGDVFKPIPGAAGFQHSNPSVLATVCLLASLQVFSQTSMTAIRQKSVLLTNYLESILDDINNSHEVPLYEIITPKSVEDRGTQLSVKFREGLMLKVLKGLEKEGIVVDERKPDVIRIAPVPLYNTFEEVWRFGSVFERVLKDVVGNTGRDDVDSTVV